MSMIWRGLPRATSKISRAIGSGWRRRRTSSQERCVSSRVERRRARRVLLRRASAATRSILPASASTVRAIARRLRGAPIAQLGEQRGRGLVDQMRVVDRDPQRLRATHVHEQFARAARERSRLALQRSGRLQAACDQLGRGADRSAAQLQPTCSRRLGLPAVLRAASAPCRSITDHGSRAPLGRARTAIMPRVLASSAHWSSMSRATDAGGASQQQRTAAAAAPSATALRARRSSTLSRPTSVGVARYARDTPSGSTVRGSCAIAANRCMTSNALCGRSAGSRHARATTPNRRARAGSPGTRATAARRLTSSTPPAPQRTCARRRPIDRSARNTTSRRANTDRRGLERRAMHAPRAA